MSKNNAPLHRRSAIEKPGAASGPLFWWAFISAIVITLIPIAFWLAPYFRLYRASDSEVAAMRPFWFISIAVIQIGALATGLYNLKRNWPLGRGLLVGLLVIDIVGLIVALLVFLFLLYSLRGL